MKNTIYFILAILSHIWIIATFPLNTLIENKQKSTQIQKPIKK